MTPRRLALILVLAIAAVAAIMVYTANNPGALGRFGTPLPRD